MVVSIAFVAVPITGSETGDDAPTFYLRDLSGGDFFASKVYGESADKPSAVVLSFFATWCIPCREEAPQLQILSQKYPHIQFYLVSYKDQPDLVLKWLNDVGVELPVLLDRYGRTAQKFSVVGSNDEGKEIASLPSLFAIDKKGQIAYQHTGYTKGDEKELDKILENLD